MAVTFIIHMNRTFYCNFGMIKIIRKANGKETRIISQKVWRNNGTNPDLLAPFFFKYLFCLQKNYIAYNTTKGNLILIHFGNNNFYTQNINPFTTVYQLLIKQKSMRKCTMSKRILKNLCRAETRILLERCQNDREKQMKLRQKLYEKKDQDSQHTTATTL